MAARRSCRLPPSSWNRPSGSRISLAWPNSATTRRVCSMITGRFRHAGFMRRPSLPAWARFPSSTAASGQTTKQPRAGEPCGGFASGGRRFGRSGHSRAAVPSAPEPSCFVSLSFSCSSRFAPPMAAPGESVKWHVGHRWSHIEKISGSVALAQAPGLDEVLLAALGE